MHLSRSSSFYYEHQHQQQQQQQQQQNQFTSDLAVTPTASPDDDEEDYADGHRKSTNKSSSFFTNKLQENLTNSSNPNMSNKRAPPIFKIEGDEEEEEEIEDSDDVGRGKYLVYDDDEFNLETPMPSPLVKLNQTNVNPGVNSLNGSEFDLSNGGGKHSTNETTSQTVSAPINMKLNKRLSQQNNTSNNNYECCNDDYDGNDYDNDGGDDEFSSTIKENIHFVKSSELIGINGDIGKSSSGEIKLSCNENKNSVISSNVNSFENNESIHMGSKNAQEKSFKNKNKNKKRNKKKVFKVTSSSSSSSTSSTSSSLSSSPSKNSEPPDGLKNSLLSQKQLNNYQIGKLN